MTKRPLVVTTIAFAAGIAAAYYSSWPLSLIGLATALAGVALALGWAFWSDGRGGPTEQTNLEEGNAGGGAAGWSFLQGPLFPILLVALFFFLGAAWGRLDLAQKRSSLLDDLNTHLYLIGRVAEEPRVYANRVVYILEAWEVRQGDWREAVREKVEVSVYRPRRKAQGGGGLGGGQAGEKKGGGGREGWAAAGSGTEGARLAAGNAAVAAGAAVAGHGGDGASTAPAGANAAAGGVGGSPVPAATAPPYRYGDVLMVYGQLELPPTARNPGEFDYRTYLARRGIFTRMGVEPQDARLLGHRPASPVMELVYAAKGRALAAIEQALPPREAGILAAVLFGDQERLEEEDVEVYRTLGVYHVFAVSGQQVGFVLLLAVAASSALRLGRRGRLLLGGALVIFYMALTGFSPSVTRAGVMALVGLVAATLGEEPDPYTALAAAALAILVWRPYELFGPGFQLSFLATWGLIYLYGLFDELLAFLTAWRSYVAVTLAAQTAVLWHTAYYFNLLSPGALPANLLVLPAIGAVTTVGLLLLFLSLLLPALGSLLAVACGGLLYGLSEALAALAAVKGLALAVAKPPWWSGALYLAALIGFREAWRNRFALPPLARGQPGAAAVLAAIPLAVLTVWLLLPGRTNSLEVVFLDVGQGDATYIRTPAGRHILIDGGGTPAGLESGFDVGEKVVAPFLLRRGVHRLDLVVSTHPDGDHLQGLFAVLRRVPASMVLMPPRYLFGQGYAAFLAFLAEQGIPYREVSRGAVVQVDPGIYLAVLNPPLGPEAGAGPASPRGSGSPENNRSLVLKMAVNEVSFLFTGDIEAEAMAELVNAYQGGSGLRSTVFKVPHHGSPYGLEEDFLAAVSPRLAVIQVGAKNNFGHPAPAVLEYWQRRQVPVYRTDRHGAITVLSDGHGVVVKTVLPFAP